MQVFGPFMDGFCNVHIQLWEHLRAKTFAALDEHTLRKEALATPEQVQERARMIRHAFLDSLGGLPDSQSPLNPHVVDVLPRDGFRIEKVIFESQPSVFVTSLLYVPDGLDGPAPGVLFVCGHAREAKGYPEYQRVCHNLACNGFVVLAVDPTGQGERVSHLDPETGEEAIGWGTAEHSYQGLQCILAGTSIARYFLFDAMRGIDYLQSRPEVDPDRIGVTGNSGGGTQTSLLCMAGDERVKAAVPCTYVTAREQYYMTGQPQDAEQLQFGMTKNGINFDDFFIPFAPRPLLIGAVDSDYFCPEGTALTHGRLRHVYRTFGREDDVDCVFAPGGHQYCRELREAAVNWFRRHLLEAEPDFVTAEDDQVPILTDEELWCTSRGHVLTDFPEAKTPFHRNLAALPERTAVADAERLRNGLIDAMAIRERLESPVDLYPRVIHDEECDGLRVRSISLISEPGILVAGGLITVPGEDPTEAVLYLTPAGCAGIEDSLEEITATVQDGRAVFVADVRGKGTLKADAINAHGEEFPGSLFGTESWLSFSAYCLGESLLGMRVFDVIRAAHYLRHRAGFPRVGLRAEGIEPALWGYLAAAIDTSLDPVHVDDLIESFRAIATTQLYRSDFTLSLMAHGVLHACDLPDLRALFKGRTLEVTEASAAMQA